MNLDKSSKSRIKMRKGGTRTLRTRTAKSKTPPKALSRDELSGKIQWFIDFAGTEDIMNHIIKNLTIFKKSDSTAKNSTAKNSTAKNSTAKKTTVDNLETTVDNLERIVVVGNLDPDAGYKNKIVFNTYMNGIGHWIYFSRTGEEFNSYKLGHQKPQTNQFCQSFATMYLLKDWGLSDMPDFFSRLQSSLGTKTVTAQNEIWGHNIEVIMDMWKWIFNHKSDKTWIIEEMKLINNEYIEFNGRTRNKKKHYTLIAEKTPDIDYSLIENKLNDIVGHKSEIARET